MKLFVTNSLVVVILSLFLLGCKKNTLEPVDVSTKECEVLGVNLDHSKKIQSYFSGACFNLDQEFYEDVTGDDEKDNLYLVVSEDCTTCRIKYLFIFDHENLIKTLELDEPEDFQFSKNEFSVIEPVRKQEEAESSPSERKRIYYSL